MGPLGLGGWRRARNSTRTRRRAIPNPELDRKYAIDGCPFGYRLEPIVAGDCAPGVPKTAGQRFEIDPQMARIVVRIFEGYAYHVLGLRTLADHLNREQHPSPRGDEWAPAAVLEILRNPIYRGERIWNRSYWVNDHETTAKLRRRRPEREWARLREDAWRIVSDELWYAAQDARDARAQRAR